jgi:F0F1-type ATP synthase delta subunit
MTAAATQGMPEEPRRIDIAERIATLRKEAQELRFFARAAENQDVRRLLEIEAADREEQAEALENWSKSNP